MSKIYKNTPSGPKALTAQEIKATIMQAHGWTASEYRKNYDIFKNKLRAYESYSSARGVPVEKQSPVAVLYKQAKTMINKKKAGKPYKPSYQMQKIQAFPAYSITKGRKVAAERSTKAAYRADEIIRKSVTGKMANFIGAHAIAQEIAWKYMDNPAAMERALSDYADAIKARRDELGNVSDDSPIRDGETAGSPDDVAFDYSGYGD